MKFPLGYFLTHRDIKHHINNNDLHGALTLLRSNLAHHPIFIEEINANSKKFYLNELVRLEEMEGPAANDLMLKSQVIELSGQIYRKYLLWLLTPLIPIFIILGGIGYFYQEYHKKNILPQTENSVKPSVFAEITDEELEKIIPPIDSTPKHTPEINIEEKPTKPPFELEDLPIAYEDSGDLTEKGIPDIFGAALKSCDTNEKAHFYQKKYKGSEVRYFPEEPTKFKFKTIIPNFKTIELAREESRKWEKEGIFSWPINYKNSIPSPLK